APRRAGREFAPRSKRQASVRTGPCSCTSPRGYDGTVIQPERPAVAVAAPTLEQFFDQVRSADPFGVNRIVPAAVLHEVVPQVHHAPFARLEELVYKAGR